MNDADVKALRTEVNRLRAERDAIEAQRREATAAYSDEQERCHSLAGEVASMRERLESERTMGKAEILAECLEAVGLPRRATLDDFLARAECLRVVEAERDKARRKVVAMYAHDTRDTRNDPEVERFYATRTYGQAWANEHYPTTDGAEPGEGEE